MTLSFLCESGRQDFSFKRIYQACLFLTVTMLAGCIDGGANSTEQGFSIENYQGKWFVLNYWAEWCAPCRKEIPELNKLQQDFPEQVAVAAANFDGLQGEELLQRSDAMGIAFEVLAEDPANILRLARPASLPTTYIYNPAGELVAKLVGPQTVESLLKQTTIGNQNGE